MSDAEAVENVLIADAAARNLATAALVAGTVDGVPAGDVMGGLDEHSVNVGKLAGRIEVLKWAQRELELQLERVTAADRFADTRALEEFLRMVGDSLRAVQDGSGEWGGLVRTVVGDSGTGPGEGDRPPDGTVGR